MSVELEMVKKQGYELTKELIEVSGIKEGQILGIGCSTSEIIGKKIGSFSSFEVAEVLFEGIYSKVMIPSVQTIFLIAAERFHLYVLFTFSHSAVVPSK